jgi:hypothetical protein
VLARAQQDAVWERQQAQNKLRSLLREYYASALASFDDLAAPVAREVLTVAPTPDHARRLRRTTLRAAVIRAGRQRGIDAEVERILTGLRRDQLRQPLLVEHAMGQQALAHLRALTTAADNADCLQTAMTQRFEQHPDSELITSLPGLGEVLGARVLGELGDDRVRFADARSVKASPAPHPSPAHRGPDASSRCAPSATNDWGKPDTSGPSHCCANHRAPEPTTTGAVSAATVTPPHCATSRTASWASSSTAFNSTCPTTSAKHSRLRKPRPLDKLTSSDVFPDRTALVRLLDAILAEQHDEWTEMRRHIGLGILARSRLTKITNEASADQEVMSTRRKGGELPRGQP